MIDASRAVPVHVKQAGDICTEGVAPDGNLVTAQVWPDHPGWITSFFDAISIDVSHETAAIADD